MRSCHLVPRCYHPAEMRRALRGTAGISAVVASLNAACAPVPRPTPPSSAALAQHTALTQHPSHEPLTEAERNVLETGQTVVRPFRLDVSKGQYVGGVSYHLVKAPPARVMSAIEHSPNLQHMFPVTLEATEVDRGSGLKWVEFTQGKAFVTVNYTVSVETRPGEVQFWMDPVYPHDIRDVWGRLRVTRYDADQSLITVGFALDLGPGIVRALFERHIQLGVLTTAGRIANFVEQQWNPAGQGVAGVSQGSSD